MDINSWWNADNYHFARTQAVEAANLDKQTTQVDVGNVIGWTGLGNAYALMPDHEHAIEAYRQ